MVKTNTPLLPSLSFSVKYIVKRLTYRVFVVYKETEEDIDTYFVRATEKGWICSCIGNSLFGRECKHIKMVREYLETGRNVFEQKFIYKSNK